MPNKYDEKPYWWPQKIDAEYIEHLREEYPEETDGLDDESVVWEFDEDKMIGDFSDTWDHVGDAREDYEPLAATFLDLVEVLSLKPSDFKGGGLSGCGLLPDVASSLRRRLGKEEADQ